MSDLLVRSRKRDDLARRTHGIVLPQRATITSSAQIMAPSRMLRLRNYDWQSELWNFFRSGVGAFKYGMLWHSQTMSRVRLTAAVIEPGGDEPTPITDGPAAELMAQFFGGTAGQSQYMREMDLQLQMPGEGWVVTEDDEMGDRSWSVKSTSELQVRSGRVRVDGRMKTMDIWEIEVDEGVWKPL